MGNLEINIDEIEEVKEYSLLPDGKYLAIVTESSVVPTKDVLEGRAETGRIAKFTFTIFDEKFAGRKVFKTFNVENPSAKAQQIGLGQLKSLCLAADKGGLVSDTSELHDIPVVIKVTTKKGTNGYSDSNDITGFYSKNAKTEAPRPANDKHEELPDFLK